ncbi:MAG TPA: caspase family protein [Thermoanaerobaculia bacterium]
MAVVALSLACSDGARGVRPLDTVPDGAPIAFAPEQSVGLFVGVNRFEDMQPVPYAVDDAVDLAYAFSLERKTALVVPHRVVLAISGTPVKEDSKIRLRKLLDAGAVEVRATEVRIRKALQQQASLAEKDGLFVVAIASHGFNRDGTAYVLSETSDREYEQTLLSVPKLLDTVASAGAKRSLVLIDACRERVESGARGTTQSNDTAAPLMRRMKNVRGLFVLSAAAGRWLYDDHVRKNGVFTSGVLDTLLCRYENPRTALVTADHLANSVEKYVHAWILRNKSQDVRPATQAIVDGTTRDMPLAHCNAAPAPDSVTFAASQLQTRDEHGLPLWDYQLEAPIADAVAADLNGDGAKEVIAAVGHELVAFDPDKKELWRQKLAAPITAFFAADLFRKHKRQIIALSGTRVTTVDHTGELLDSYTHPFTLDLLAVERPTSRSAPRIVVSAARTVLMLKSSNLRPEWIGTASAPVTRIEIADRTGDQRNEIVLHTARGEVVLNFNGETIDEKNARFSKGR